MIVRSVMRYANISTIIRPTLTTCIFTLLVTSEMYVYLVHVLDFNKLQSKMLKLSNYGTT